MRIKTIHLAGLAAVFAGGGAKQAAADDLSISTATTTPVVTSAAANATPGDVTVTSTGSITVTAGQTAITVDSSNDVLMDGQLNSTNANNTTGVLILGGNSGTITLDEGSSISLLEDFTPTDSDSDGDLDSTLAIGSNRYGVFLQAGPTFAGDVINRGAIIVEGNNSGGIRLDGLLTGDLTSSGSISVTGDNSYGIGINGGAAGGVTGDVSVTGGVLVRGVNSVGLLVGAPIGGALNIGGAWTVSGYDSLVVPNSTLEPDDIQAGGPAVQVNYSVAGGITVLGIGVEDDLDDDNDGIDDIGDDADPNDDALASIATYGPAPALLIDAAPGVNLVLGATASGYGLNVRGLIQATGLYDGISATGIELIGGAGGATVTTANGVLVDNFVITLAREANATGIHIGNLVDVPNLVMRRRVSSTVVADAGQTAYGVRIDGAADVPNVVNRGEVAVTAIGATGNAVVIQDLSNSVTSITNSGEITADIFSIDDDPNDNVPPPPITGSAIAIDVSASTINVTLTQEADAVFTDQDANDDDSTIRPDVLIRGDILFGSGNDTFNLLAGEVEGDLSFGGGADTFLLDGGASYTGRLNDSNGSLTLNVVDGSLILTNDTGSGTVNLTSATFAADAILGIDLSDVAGESVFLNASGAITFAPGSQLLIDVPDGLPVTDTITFITAAGGLDAAAVLGAVTTDGTSFLYNLSVGYVLGDPNSLEATYAIKTPAQLGLTANETAAFDPILDALRLDDDASAAFAALSTSADFFDAYEDLLPSYSSAAAEIATTAIRQGQAASNNRLSATRLHGLDEVSIWAQEIGYSVARTPPTGNGQEYDGNGFGVAFGIDGPLDNGALFGLSAAFIASEVTEEGRPEGGEISAWFAQANAYLGAGLGPVDLDLVGGFGGGKLRSRRFVEIGDSFDALSEGEWWAWEGHGSARVSAPMSVADWFTVTPQGALTYVALSESSYTESGGGAAIDYDVDSAFSHRLWADAGVEFSARFQGRGQAVIAPRLFLGYRANVLDEEAERTVRFASGGADFTLVDEPIGDGGPIVGIGFDATNGYSTFSLGYEGEFTDQVDRHSVNAAVRFRF
jgi:outer membrane autotransporter protein